VKKGDRMSEEEIDACPFCGSLIDLGEHVCPNCSEIIEQEDMSTE